MDEQQERFLRAIYEVQDEIGRANVMSIASRLGLDIINSKADRDLYEQTILELLESGYLDCLANDYGVTCGIVRLTGAGQDYAES
jgi:hypothetical protein